jgi:hypothetical protein
MSGARRFRGYFLRNERLVVRGTGNEVLGEELK